MYAMLNSIKFLFGKEIDTTLIPHADCLTPRVELLKTNKRPPKEKHLYKRLIFVGQPQVECVLHYP